MVVEGVRRSKAVVEQEGELQTVGRAHSHSQVTPHKLDARSV